MRKYLILISFILLVGCTNNLEIQKEEYISMKKALMETSKYTDVHEMPFDIMVNVNRLTDSEVMYTVTIDNPKDDIYSIKAIAIHNQITSDIFPSIGIFDDMVNLIPNDPDLKGILLVGYIDTEKDIEELDLEFRVLVEYTSNLETKRTFYKINEYE